MLAAGNRVPSFLPDSLPAEVLELCCVVMPREENAICAVLRPAQGPHQSSARGGTALLEVECARPFTEAKGHPPRRHKNSLVFFC